MGDNIQVDEVQSQLRSQALKVVYVPLIVGFVINVLTTLPVLLLDLNVEGEVSAKVKDPFVVIILESLV